MKRTCLFLCLFLCCWSLSGCENPSPEASVADVLGGLKLSDLRDTSADLERADFLINFRVFQYVLDPNDLSVLEPLYESSKHVVFQDRQAFDANGFAITVMSREDANQIARALNTAGAKRVSIGVVGVPPETTDILSSVPVYKAQPVSYYTSADNRVTETVYPGFLGWTLFAQDSARPNTILLKASPAYWRTGAEDLRIRFGKEPINFNLLEFASFQTRLNVGDFILLAPRRAADPATLSHALFTEFGKKTLARCMVLVCESAGL